MVEPRIFFPEHVEIKEHRSGWNYAMAGLLPFHHPCGIRLDDFIENNFSWTYDAKRAARVIPYRSPWIGFIHNPPHMPRWFGGGRSSNQDIFERKYWKQSISQCRMLFTLSKYHRDFLRTLYYFPIETLYHPTETPETKFTWDAWESNDCKQVIQVGWWLRNAESIHRLQTNLKRAQLKVDSEWMPYMRLAPNRFTPDPEVHKIAYLPNQEYDLLLSQNIVFLDLHDASANNAIIESIVRNTPVLVTDHPATREYLGKTYPLYFNSLEQAGNKSNDMGALRAAHDYLRDDPENIKQQLQREYFVNTFVSHLEGINLEQ